MLIDSKIVGCQYRATKWRRRCDNSDAITSSLPSFTRQGVGLEAFLLQLTSQRKRFPMEWFEGRISKRSVEAAEAPKTRAAITELVYKADKLNLSSARERILELALQHQHSGSHVENLKAELSVSYAINRGFRQQLETEMEANGKLSAELKHEIEENERLNAALKVALLENAKLLELTRSLRHQADGLDGLRAVLEIIADEIKPKTRRRRFLAPTNTGGPSLLPRGAPAHP